MAMNTYTLLADTVVRWLNREGFASLTSEVEDFVAMGQRRIHRECDLNAMETVDPAFVISAQAMTVPSGFLRTKTITIQQSNDHHEVKGDSHKKVMSDGYPARPTRYSVIGESFYFGPPPDQNYTAQIVYFKGLDILSTSVASNWLSVNAPELLLFATLLEASLFMKDDVRAKVWEARYSDIKQTLASAEDRQDKEGGSLQVQSLQRVS